ncbi:hypothetical protein [Cryobacterium sp. CG_9.6]|uniref:hypothetical protein n=1 Tax=Cryobacterium sp. CG_9.6 TaxID=2760710 RepID=UPI00247493AE|nr:hypothetical protein [Cryobacterium sp. CG_9.6]MDH6236004.1 hypothetical protein [Cryobacterium sp. CG_9.6]
MKNAARTRKRARLWFDPRFGIGLVLVVASIAGVAVIVTTADRTTEVYVASSALLAGTRIESSDLQLAHVRLGDTATKYLTPALLPSDGLIVTRTVQAGELVPTAAVGTVAGASVTSVVVMVRPNLAESIAPGSLVDVWAAQRVAASQFAPPEVLVPSAVVVRVIAPTGLMASSDGQSVEIMVPKGVVGPVLESIANGDVVSVVAVDTPLTTSEGSDVAGTPAPSPVPSPTPTAPLTGSN